MNKRGLSMIITTLILIVLVLVAVAIIWVVVNNILKGGTEGIALGKFTLDAGIKNVNIDNSSNNVSLTVKRNPGKGELSGMKFIFYDGANSEIITEEITLKELGSRRFNFHLINLDVDNLIRISIVPIFKSDSGKEIMGNIVDTYNVKDGVGCIANCTDKECGSDGCGGICGDCVILHGDGWYCQDGTCIEGTNPCNLASASWNETNVVEGTLVTLNVVGTGCTGIDLNYTIWEDDALLNPDDFADSFIATGLGTTWIAEWQDDTDGGQSNPPEYYFIARVVGESEEITSSDPLLEVTQGCTITCATGPGCRSSLANGQIVSGECCGAGDCYDCETGYSWNGSSCVAGCLPETCSSLGYECGSWPNGTCAGTLDCGSCGLHTTCPSGTCVCDSGWGDCNNDNVCDCDLSLNSCVGGNCVEQLGNVYYVDNAATGNNEGTSWINAWQSFADINWISISPGDIIYISGGSTSKTYNELLKPITSGTIGNPITIKIGQDSGHNGQVIITNVDYGIRLAHFYDGGWQPLEYFIVDGNYNGEPRIRVTNCGNSGISVDGTGVNNIVITYLEIDNNGDANNENGIRIQVSDQDIPKLIEISHCKIHDNYQDQIFCTGPVDQGTTYGRILIHHNDIYNLNDDGFEATAGGIDFYNNLVHNKVWSGGTGHPDGVQFMKGYTRVWNNKFYNLSDANSYIFIDLYKGEEPLDAEHILVYNNLIYQDEIITGGFDALRGIAFKGEASITSIRNAVIAGNTIVNMPAWGITLTLNNLGPDFVDDIYVENNILYNCFTSGGGQVIMFGNGAYVMGSEGDSVDVVIDYNCINAGLEGSSLIGHSDDVIYTYDDWVALTGAQDSGIIANPDLLSSYRLADTSTLINAGTDLSAYFTTDLDGVNRNNYAPWDIGAYEYVS